MISAWRTYWNWPVSCARLYPPSVIPPNPVERALPLYMVYYTTTHTAMQVFLFGRSHKMPLPKCILAKHNSGTALEELFNGKIFTYKV